MKRKQFWVITKQDGTTAVVFWTRAGLVINDDTRTPDQIEAAALAKRYEVNYCSIAHGIGTKTVGAICNQLGYGWDATHRMTEPYD